MKQYFIGIDIGTSAAKTLLMDEHGVVTAQVSREYPLYQPANGWAEQDPEDWRTLYFRQSGNWWSALRQSGAGHGNRLLRPEHGLVMLVRTENQFGDPLSGAIRDQQSRQKKCAL